MKLYVYDHCPYCTKARMIFGFKDLPYEMVTLLNDDVETPTRMIGRKMVPILEKDDGTFMPESMDIVHEIDAEFGGAKILIGAGDNPALHAWMMEAKAYLNPLAMPRWVKSPLKEFATEGARRYFTGKKEAMIGSFESNMERSKEMKAQATEHLKQLDGLIRSPDAVSGTLSDDDIHLYAVLRSLSIVKDIAYPANVKAYRKKMAQKSSVSLHDDIAI